MESDEAKPADDQVQPDAAKEATSFGNIVVGTLIGAGFMVVGVLTYWSLTQWVPSEEIIISSTYFRNGFIGVAAMVGLGLATWRSMQTEQQLRFTAEQFTLSREQLALAQVAEQRNTLREAVQMLDHENDLTRAAGIELLSNIQEKTLKRSADDILRDLVEQTVVIDGDEASARALIRWLEEQPRLPSGMHIKNASFAPLCKSMGHCTLVSVSLQDYQGTVPQRITRGTFYCCALINCIFDMDDITISFSLSKNLDLCVLADKKTLTFMNGIIVVDARRDDEELYSDNIKLRQSIVVDVANDPIFYQKVKTHHRDEVRFVDRDGAKIGRRRYGAGRAPYTIVAGKVFGPEDIN